MEIDIEYWYNADMFAFVFQSLARRANDLSRCIAEGKGEDIIGDMWCRLKSIYDDAEEKAEAIGERMPFTYGELTDFVKKGGIWQ